MQSTPRPTGLFVGNDFAAVQIYPILQQMGVVPGRDITIISCDNEGDPGLAGLQPRPASIEVGAEEVGWQAVRRLVSRLENPDEPAILINVAPRVTGPGICRTSCLGFPL